MENLIKLLQIILTVIASVAVGNRFLFHARRLRANGEPLYKVYATVPGIIIILVLLIPIVLKLAGVL